MLLFKYYLSIWVNGEFITPTEEAKRKYNLKIGTVWENKNGMKEERRGKSCTRMK